MKKKVVVVGTGATARALVSTLVKIEQNVLIHCVSNKPGAFLKTLPTRKNITVSKVFAEDHAALVKVARGSTLIINASLPDFNLKIMKAALAAKIKYQDLATRFPDDWTVEQFKLDRAFKRAGLLAVINTGVSPGVTNLHVRAGADRLDRVDSIKIRALEEQRAHELVASWSIETTLDEITAQPIVYKNGRFIAVQPFSHPEHYTFPEPFGKKYTVTVFGDEVKTIPKYIKTKNVDYKIAGLDIEFAQALYELGLFDTDLLHVDGKRISPVKLFSKLAPAIPDPKEMIRLLKNGIVENAVFASVVEAAGVKDGQKVRVTLYAVYPDIHAIQKKLPGATYISYPTGIAAASFAKVILTMPGKGVMPPEALNSQSRDAILEEVKKQGVTMSEKVEYLS